jgi:hypothetical protein
MTTLVKVPFVPKRPEGSDAWQGFGSTEAEYRKWAAHVCGIACVRSLVLAAHGVAPTLWHLTQRAVALGVFQVESPEVIRGAFHAPLRLLLLEHGIDASLFRNESEDALWRLAGQGALILSIRLSALGDELSGTHLVLTVGRKDGHLLVHDNAKLLCRRGAACRVSHAKLATMSNGRGLFVPWSALSGFHQV